MRLLLSLLILLPLIAIAQWNSESARAALDGRQLDAVEGVWQFPDDGATLLIVQATATTYDIIMLDSPRLDLAPGVKIGSATVAPGEGTYDAHLDNKQVGSGVKKSKAVLTVKDGILKFKPYSEGWSVSLRRWLPYFRKITVKENHKPDGLTGAQRIYPPTFKPIL